MNINGEPTRNDKSLNGETSLGDSTANDMLIEADLTVKGTSSLEGQLDMNNAKIVNLGTPTNNGDATNKQYVDSVIPDVTGFLKTDGSNSMGAALNMSSNQIKNVSNASASSDAVNLSQLTAIIPDLSPYFEKNGSIAATGEFDLNSNKITGLANGTAATDAVNLSQIPAAPDLSPYFEKDGSIPASGNFNMNSNKITGLANGSSSSHAVNLSQLTAVITDVNTNTSDITSLNSSVAANTASISTNTTNISNNSSTIDTLVGVTNTNSSAISTIQGDYFKKDGSILASGNFNLNSNKITNVTDPTDNQDAATKKYVDDNAGLWTELGGNIYYDVGSSNVGIGLSAPSYPLEVRGDMRVAQGEDYDAGFIVQSSTGNIRTFNNYNQTADINSAIVLRQFNDWLASPKKYTELEIQQIYRNTSQNNSAVWGINVRSENGSFTGSQNNSAILCLCKDNGSVVVNSSRNNNGVRLRVHGTAGGSSGYSVISDDRIKYHEENITNALAIINKLKAQKYQKIVESLDDTGKWIPSDAEWDSVKDSVNAKGQRLYQYIEEIGFIAQDVRKIPELSFCVTGEEEDEAGDQTPLLVQYQDIFALSIQAIQELDKRRKEDTKRINNLNKRLVILEEKMRNVETNTEKEYIL